MNTTKCVCGADYLSDECNQNGHLRGAQLIEETRSDRQGGIQVLRRLICAIRGHKFQGWADALERVAVVRWRSGEEYAIGPDQIEVVGGGS